MAIIATVSYSKKIPTEVEYSSQGYHLSLQTEIMETDPRSIRARLHETFELVKSSVESELTGGQAPVEMPAHPPAQERGGRRDSGDRASNRQIKFLTDLATRQGMSLADLNADIRRRFGIDGLYDLDKKQASRLLDELNGRKAA